MLYMHEFSLKELFHGPISSKIALARKIFALYGKTLQGNTVLYKQFINMEERHAALAYCMQEANLAAICTACGDKNDSGGCCSLYMADENDTIQLLINLLTGGKVDTRRDDGKECCFLGATGCSLRYKPIFCLNYLCDTIRKTASKDHLDKLDKATGRLLQAQYAAEQILLTELRKLS